MERMRLVVELHQFDGQRGEKRQSLRINDNMTGVDLLYINAAVDASIWHGEELPRAIWQAIRSAVVA